MSIIKAMDETVLSFTMEGDEEPLFEADLEDLTPDGEKLCRIMGAWHMLGDCYAGYQQKSADAGKTPRVWVAEILERKWAAIVSGEALTRTSTNLPLIGLAMLRADPSASEDEVRAILDAIPGDGKQRARVHRRWLKENKVLKAAYDAIRAERAMAKAQATAAGATEADFDLASLTA